jgi:hypothetical protein
MSTLLRVAAALAATTALCGYAFAGASPRPNGGTSADPSATTAVRSAAAPSPNVGVGVFTNAQYAVAGTGLRNRSTGTINISGFVAPLQKAILYWGVLCPKSSPCGSSIMIQRLAPTENATQTFTGTLIGTGADPCWGSNHAEFYRAYAGSMAPPKGSGGTYQVSIPKSEQGITDSSDPWVEANDTLPQWEGASLVLVGTGTSTVNITDAGLAGTGILAPVDYTLTLFGTPSGGPVIWSGINADGQVGTSIKASLGAADEQVTINGTQVSGPSTGPVAWDTDSDYNGNDASPLPQLWDSRTHDISGVELSSPLDISVTSLSGTGNDCFEEVANIIAF